jgi:type III restriction enzyme
MQAKKDFVQQITVTDGMEYRIMKSTDADNRRYRMLP